MKTLQKTASSPRHSSSVAGDLSGGSRIPGSILFPTIVLALGFGIAVSSPLLTANETTPLEGFEKWIAEEVDGLPLPASDREAGADPDHDGLNNLLEYALDSDPLFPSDHAVPATRRVAGELVFTYDRNLSKADIVYEVQISRDLRHWEVRDTQVMIAKGPIERRRLTLPAEEGALFVRLQIREVSRDAARR